MDSPLHLGVLPAEIRSTIIRMVKRYVHRQPLRLISKSWNESIIGPPLYISRVYIHSGEIPGWHYQTLGAQHNSDARKRVHMYAIILNHAKERIGVGKWLRLHQRFPGAVEAKCEPYKFHSNSVLGNLAARLLRREPKERNGALFKQFFSIIAQIETVILDHMHDPYFKVFDAMVSTLGEVRIEKLIVKEHTCDEEMFIRIVNLVQKHGVRHLTILCNECCEEIGVYLLQLVQLGVIIDLYEEDIFKENRGCFKQTDKLWTALEAKLKKEHVYFKLRCKLGDATFNTFHNDLETQVRTHVRCLSINQDVEPDRAIHSRGFNRSFLPYFESTRYYGS